MAKKPPEEKQGKRKVFKKKEKRTILAGIAHIQATFNNTVVTIADLEGNVVSWALSRAKAVDKAVPFDELMGGDK